MINKKASILLFTLLILSAITILIQQLVRSVWVGSSFNTKMIQKEQARLLASGGINLAISQLTLRAEKKEKEKKEPVKEEGDKELKKMIARVYPYLNRWQVFDIEEKFYGMQGEVKVCISCENGKININQAFDFSKQEFKKEYINIFKGLSLRRVFGQGEFVKILTKFFKKRKRKLDDISELSEVEELKKLNIFYEPPKIPKRKRDAKSNSTIFLQDLFTTWSDTENIELMFFSDSMCSIFGLRRPLAIDPEVKKEKYEVLVKVFKKNWGADWEKNWSFLQQIYGEKPKVLKDFNRILSKEFGPKVYSVLSCGIVGGTKQKLLAVIKEIEEKNKKEEKVEGEKEKTSDKKEAMQKEGSCKKFKIIKIYWL